MEFYLSVANGIASLFDYEEMFGMPLAEGHGDTNDAAVADLFSKLTFTHNDIEKD